MRHGWSAMEEEARLLDDARRERRDVSMDWIVLRTAYFYEQLKDYGVNEVNELNA